MRSKRNLIIFFKETSYSQPYWRQILCTFSRESGTAIYHIIMFKTNSYWAGLLYNTKEAQPGALDNQEGWGDTQDTGDTHHTHFAPAVLIFVIYSTSDVAFDTIIKTKMQFFSRKFHPQFSSLQTLSFHRHSLILNWELRFLLRKSS